MGRTSELTDDQGGLLALIQRKGPMSGYQIAKDYENSPVFTINTAKGKLYPVLERLIDHGWVTSRRVVEDRRGTKIYSCTELGRSALRAWLGAFRSEHELPADHLRRKVQALDLLAPEEQLAWVETARTHLRRRLEAVLAYDADGEGPFGRLAQENARESLQGRLHWLDRIELSIRDGC